MSVQEAIRTELVDAPGWLLETALALATALDADEDGLAAKAAAARQLAALVEQAKALTVPKAGSTVDDLATRRAGRRTGTEGEARPAASGDVGAGSGGAGGKRRAGTGPVAIPGPRSGPRRKG